MLVCPESPTWLLLKGRRREAETVAQQLWGEDALAQLGAGASGRGGCGSCDVLRLPCCGCRRRCWHQLSPVSMQCIRPALYCRQEREQRGRWWR